MNKKNNITEFIIRVFRAWYIIGGFALFIAILEQQSLKAVLGFLALLIIAGIIESTRNNKIVKNSSFGFDKLFIGWFLMMFLMSLNNNWWFYNHIERESERFAKEYSKVVINTYQIHLYDARNKNLDNEIEYSRQKLIASLNDLHKSNPANDSIPYYISKIEIQFPETYIEGDIGWGILGPETTQKYREVIDLGPEYFSNSKEEVNIYDIAKKINPTKANKNIIQNFQKNYMNMKGGYFAPRESFIFLSKSNDITFQRKITISPTNKNYTTNQTSENLKLTVFKKSLTNLIFSFYKTWDITSEKNREYISKYTLHGSVPLIFYGLICLLIPSIIVWLDKRHKDNTNQIEKGYLDQIKNLEKDDIPDELWDAIVYIQEKYPDLEDEIQKLRGELQIERDKTLTWETSYEKSEKKYKDLEKKYDEDIDIKLTNAASKETQEKEGTNQAKSINNNLNTIDNTILQKIENKSYYDRLQKALLYNIDEHDENNIIYAIDDHHSKPYADKLYKRLNQNPIVKKYIIKIKTSKNKTTKRDVLEIKRKVGFTKNSYELVIISARNDAGYSIRASLTTDNFLQSIRLVFFIKNTMKIFKNYKIVDKTYKR